MELPARGRYRHFKGGEYELLYIARHSETGEYMVVYRALYETDGEQPVWVRPLSMWSETVEKDGRQVKRFTALDEAPEISSEAEPAADIYGILKEVYGYDSFRSGQEDVIKRILAGQDTLGVMPTGAGKSVCYQVPALALSGTAIVVSPLISLMKDQVNALIQNGVPAAYINTSLTERQITTALGNALSGKYKVIYVAPERLLTGRFQSIMSQMDISLVAVDEAHCISQWGQDFRPAYLDIPEFIASLPRRPRVCAFTATATEKVRSDIKKLLKLRAPFELVTGFDRPNLYYSVINRPANRNKALLDLMHTYGEMNGIVYCATRKNVEEVCDLLTEHAYNATRYHAGLSEEERHKNQEDFSSGEKQIIVATNAFGMGIDKSDVRFVIHYNMPKDPESYYQEAGRAGRDGMHSDCILIYSPQDIITQKYFIDNMGDEAQLDSDVVQKLKTSALTRLEAMKKYATTTGCLRKVLLEYFGEHAPARCGRCQNCEGTVTRVDAKEPAAVILSCVREMRRPYGIALLINVVRGSSEERIKQFRLDTVPSYGRLREYDKGTVSEIIDAMLENGVLERSDGDYPVIKAGRNAAAFTQGDIAIEITHLPVPGKKERRRSAEKRGMVSDTGLFSALRDMRMRIAKEKHVQAYMIFNDATLYEMCRVKPHTKDELREVLGVGAKKLEQYGDDVLDTITDWEVKNQ